MIASKLLRRGDTLPVSFSGITKSFGSQTVLSQMSGEFADPGITCIMGKSGSGKTTLLNILMGRLKADKGELKGITGRRIGAVFQEDRLLPWCTALENVTLVLGGHQQDTEARAMLTRMQLADCVDQKVTELSGGMKRRVAIARALVFQPEILFMDEPFRGLDDALRVAVMEVVREFSKEHAVIMVTHDPAEAGFFGARIMHIS